jgi:hypothetical protein
MLVNLGGLGVGPNTLDGHQGMSKDDKILLNYLEHVSCVAVCCLTY